MARKRHPIRTEYQELPRTDEQFLKDLFMAAKKYDFFARKMLLFIYHENHKDPSYKMYEAYFGTRNFMHLVGLKGKTINAKEFYKKCLDGTLKMKEVVFTTSRLTASSKLDALPKLLDFQYVMIYKIGDADLVRLKNEFETGLGNHDGIIGFDARLQEPFLPIPVTVVKRQITEYVSNPQNVVAVLMKEPSEGFYNTLVGCVKSGLSLETLPKEIRRKISPNAPQKLQLKQGVAFMQLSPPDDSEKQPV